MSLPPRLRGHSVALSSSTMESTPEPGIGTAGTLKRAHSPVLDAPREELPDLPKLSGHILLEVYTHKSLRLACNARFRDNERLSVLGHEILEMMTTQLLFFRKPKLTVHQIKVSRYYLNV
jgi:dsRNA-specific ribonuclease